MSEIVKKECNSIRGHQSVSEMPGEKILGEVGARGVETVFDFISRLR